LPVCWLAGLLVFWSAGKPVYQFAGMLVCQQIIISK
jgi:hypothetical protein